MPMITPITKYAVQILNPAEIKYHLDRAFYEATNGRKGPVWLDIPLDVQASMIEPDELEGFQAETVSGNGQADVPFDMENIVKKIKSAK